MNKTITSIRYPFAIDRDLGVLMEEKDFSRHVRQMMLQVLFTNPGERINRPEFGCGIRRMVFAPNSDTTASLSEVLIVQALDRWLGDVISVEKVEAIAINERLEIKIMYLLKPTQERQFLNVPI